MTFVFILVAVCVLYRTRCWVATQAKLHRERVGVQLVDRIFQWAIMLVLVWFAVGLLFRIVAHVKLVHG